MKTQAEEQEQQTLSFGQLASEIAMADGATQTERIKRIRRGIKRVGISPLQSSPPGQPLSTMQLYELLTFPDDDQAYDPKRNLEIFLAVRIPKLLHLEAEELERIIALALDGLYSEREDNV